MTTDLYRPTLPSLGTDDLHSLYDHAYEEVMAGTRPCDVDDPAHAAALTEAERVILDQMLEHLWAHAEAQLRAWAAGGTADRSAA